MTWVGVSAFHLSLTASISIRNTDGETHSFILGSSEHYGQDWFSILILWLVFNINWNLLKMFGVFFLPFFFLIIGKHIRSGRCRSPLSDPLVHLCCTIELAPHKFTPKTRGIHLYSYPKLLELPLITSLYSPQDTFRTTYVSLDNAYPTAFSSKGPLAVCLSFSQASCIIIYINFTVSICCENL